MSERTLKVPVEVRNFIKRLHPELKRKIRAALSDILENPGCGKALKEELEGYWSLPVGRSRIIYRTAKRASKLWQLDRETPFMKMRSDKSFEVRKRTNATQVSKLRARKLIDLDKASRRLNSGVTPQ